jgi:hypothetical protein
MSHNFYRPFRGSLFWRLLFPGFASLTPGYSPPRLRRSFHPVALSLSPPALIPSCRTIPVASGAHSILSHYPCRLRRSSNSIPAISVSPLLLRLPGFAGQAALPGIGCAHPVRLIYSGTQTILNPRLADCYNIKLQLDIKIEEPEDKG